MILERGKAPKVWNAALEPRLERNLSHRPSSAHSLGTWSLWPESMEVIHEGTLYLSTVAGPHHWSEARSQVLYFVSAAAFSQWLKDACYFHVMVSPSF